MNAATKVLKDYYDAQTSIDTMIVSSHGYRETNNFFVGATEINPRNVKTRLKPWRPLLNDDTNVIIKACNTGGGTNPKKGKNFTQQISDVLDVTVYTSRSWAVSKTNSFADQPASWYGAPDSFDPADVEKYKKPYQNIGLWLMAMPKHVARERAAEIASFVRRTGCRSTRLPISSEPRTHKKSSRPSYMRTARSRSPTRGSQTSPSCKKLLSRTTTGRSSWAGPGRSRHRRPEVE